MKYLILILALTILIAGCGPSSDLVVNDRFKGTDGVQFGFIENMPPDDSVYEDSQFKIGIELQNGAANDAQGYLSVGFDQARVSIGSIDSTDLDSGKTSSISEIVNFNLGGVGSKSIGYHGGKTRNIFNIASNKIALSEKQDTQFTFNVCYTTKTSFKEQVCIDPDIYQEVTRKKVCTVESLSTSSGQGAPVSITSVETIMIPEGDQIKPRFKIKIENSQNGLLVDESKIMEACTGKSVEKGNYNIIKITPKLEGQELKCSRVNAEGKFDLSKANDNTIQCETENLYYSSVSAHLETLEILLEYGYMDSFSKTLTIYKKEQIV